MVIGKKIALASLGMPESNYGYFVRSILVNSIHRYFGVS